MPITQDLKFGNSSWKTGLIGRDKIQVKRKLSQWNFDYISIVCLSEYTRKQVKSSAVYEKSLKQLVIPNGFRYDYMYAANSREESVCVASDG